MEVKNFMVNQQKVNEKMKGTMHRMLVIFIVVLAVAVVGSFVYMYIRSPKTADLADSKLFAVEKVYEASENVIELFENSQFEELREQYCNADLAAKMTDDVLAKAFESFGGDLGERVEITSKEGFEVEQSDVYYAMTVYKVTYQNNELTYTIMFDTDMKLAGFGADPKK